eukprot:7319303-Alexandrium_andersonii.AAC.1
MPPRPPGDLANDRSTQAYQPPCAHVLAAGRGTISRRGLFWPGQGHGNIIHHWQAGRLGASGGRRNWGPRPGRH